MKAVVAAFNQEKALVGAFSVIVQLHRLIDLRTTLLHAVPVSECRVMPNNDHCSTVKMLNLLNLIITFTFWPIINIH